jgi:alpha-1,6-mannosyltransferase
MANAVHELFNQGCAALANKRGAMSNDITLGHVVNSLLGHHAVLGSQWPQVANG